jgi:magnesium transporter
MSAVKKSKRRIKLPMKKPGLPPGSVLYVDKQQTEKCTISLIDYGDNTLDEKEIENVGDCLPYRDSRSVSWININGLHDTEIISAIGEQFGLHVLVQEDIVNLAQRPKLEDFEDYIFFCLKMVSLPEEHSEIKVEQISLILGKNWVLSFQERPGDVFDGVRQRIRLGKGRIRKLGPDYLFYALADAVVDHYYLVLENLGEKIELLDEEILLSASPEKLGSIHHLKREMIFLRKSVWPLREAFGALERGESKLIKKNTSIFLRDVYDHTIQVIDVIETFRDMLSGILDLYHSTVSNRMNEVMKVLTIIATIFIPITFIAGIYGMNFKYMPELEWRYGYLLVWLVIIVVSSAMVFYFKRKKWL